ncbi:hypothetical protein BAE44_0007037 [Dichanthelium oligosanthes]|uniref:Uncharacterized protein n=1 Tax=Dichanthelium oligosanthes TaxID=888268 RepID=A0A1E5W3H6_9POAL|nr:hypothetical protein BAE44_0007037 [Dichanthelium oligosanthes]
MQRRAVVAFVGSDTFRCEYRRTPAFGCGIVAALLSLTAVALVTAASGCFGRCGATAAESGRSCARTVCAILAWLLVVSAAVMFLYGASRNAGGTGGFTAKERRPGQNSDGSSFDFVCTELRDGVFVAASIKAGFAIACAIAAYVDIVRRRDQTATLGVAMGQPPYPAPMAYPAAQPPYGGYGAKQPAGTA